jgi:putative membrane protein
VDVDYARKMIMEHGENLKEALKLSHDIKQPPLASKTSEDLQAQGKKLVADLSSLKPEELNKAYIDTMIKDHKAALEMIDSDFLANVSNEKLKKYLEDTRAHVNEHLEKALEIQHNNYK